MKQKRTKINILLLIPHLDLGGGARRIKVYCDYLDKNKFNVSVAIYSNLVIRDLETVIGKTPVNVSPNQNDIIDFAKKQKIEIVYTFYDGQYNQFLFDLFQEFKKMAIKIVANNVFAYYDPKMDDLCDLVLFQTKMMMEIKFKGNFPKKKKFNYSKYKILYNPVNVDYFQKLASSEKEREKIRETLGFSKTDVVIGRFGRNDIVKWGDNLFQAMLRLRNYPDIKFLIVGIPRSRRLFLQRLSLLDKTIQKRIKIIEPTANDEKLMHLMQVVDIIGHGLKIGEGCSNAINEGMFWSKPVITNSTPHCDNGQVEQVENGKTGMVVNTTDQFVSAILALRNNPKLRSKLGKSGHKKVIKFYHARLIAKEFEYLIGQIFDKKFKKTAIDVSKNELQQFAKTYRQMSYNNPKPKGVISQTINFGVRAFGYIEFKFFNR